MSIAGHLAGVTEDRYGSTLTVDLAIGDTVLEVDSTTDFDEEAGGSVLINGTKLDYQAFDDPDEDDTDDDGPTSLTLTAASTIAADAGDRVWAYDPTTGSDDPVTELIALVTIDDRDDGDALPARVRAGLADQLDSDFDTYVGKAVELDVTDQGELILVDILGSKRTGSVAFEGVEDSVEISVGAAHSILLSRVPIPHTEHVHWGIDQDESQWARSGRILTVDDPDQVGHAGDLLTVKYLYVESGQPPAAAMSVDSSGSASATGVVASLAIPISSPSPGDLILLATGRSTAPGGWALIGDASSGTTHLRVYSKVSDGTETSVTVSGSDVLAGITAVCTAGDVVTATGVDDPKSATTFQVPAAAGTPLVSFAIFDGPGFPPDEHITGADQTMLENLKVQAGGLYGLAAATGRATFTSTTGSGSSFWLGVAVAAV